eukprot:13733603-Alexandrium_andersonii.AAC.1
MEAGLDGASPMAFSLLSSSSSGWLGAPSVPGPIMSFTSLACATAAADDSCGRGLRGRRSGRSGHAWGGG